ncbi:MAG: sulfonate transport system substrate-binding protein [Clostridia bacterium]|nr:sulfonate transport system substrate-binding protein [Clostridia bacterium]
MQGKYKIVVPALVVIILTLLITACSTPGTKPAAQKDKIFVTQTAPPNMLNQLKSGEIDGFVAWEPFNADAVGQGIGKVLVSSKDLWPNHPCCVLAVAPSIPSEVEQALAWAHLQATNFINDPAKAGEVLKYAQEFGGKSEAVTKEALKTIKFVEFPNQKEFRNYYEGLKKKGLIVKKPQDLGYSNDDQFFQAFLNPEVYDRVKGVKPAPVPSQIKVRLGYLRQDLHELAVYIAQKEGYYEQVGLIAGKNLELKEFANGVAVMEGFKNKEIDASYLGGAPATLKRVNDNIPIKVIAGANEEGSALVVKKEINSIKDLAGKTIAIPGVGTVQGFLLDRIAEQAGLEVQVK